MNHNLFKTTNLSQRSFFQKIFKQYPQENAVIEINNLFASKPLFQISKDNIASIENKYRINLLKEFGLNMEEFYAVYLNYCLKDKTLGAEELAELKHLKFVLNLNDRTIDKLHSKIGEIVYKQILRRSSFRWAAYSAGRSFFKEA